MKRTLVLGGPGCGKTYRLLRVMEAALARGVPPGAVAFVSFSKAAVDEARGRACERFGLTPKDLPYFRTIHSVAFRELGLRRTDVVGEEQLGEIGTALGELFTGDGSPDGPAAGRNADPLLTLDHYARTTMTGLRAAWEDHGGNVEWYRLQRFSAAYELYKRDRDLVDFTDMLQRYVDSGLPATGVRVAIVDEVQDLTVLQHAVVAKAFSDAEELWFAGDDDQSIHRWAGAAEDYFLSMTFDREVLPLSHRLPSTIFDFAQAVVGRIGRRFAKDQGAARPGGKVEWIGAPDEVDLTSGKWLLLARTRAQLVPLVEIAREQGVSYTLKKETSINPQHVRAIQAHEALRAGKRVEGVDVAAALSAAGVRRDVDETTTYTAAELGYDARPIWHDALLKIALEDREYYLACMRRGAKLTEPPRVRVETIHGAKGAEAENVLLVTDLTYRTHRGYELDPDSEHRVLYVGLTRASASLYMVAPQTAYGYPM